MNYSFKKLIQNDNNAALSFILCIVFFILFAIGIFIFIYPIINNTDKNSNFNFSDEFYGFLPYLLILLFSLINLAALLKRTYNAKHFLEDCSEVDAIIANYAEKRNRANSYFEITFSYKINNENHTKKFSIIRNKQTVKYIDNYKRKGETIKILIRNDNPKKIMIKEIFS